MTEPLATVTTVRVTVDGVTSPVLGVGPADASEAIVFLHGNPGPATDWLGLLGRVGGFARAIAPDMPGFGQADKPRDFPYSVDGEAAHLAGLLDELGIDRAHLVAHDFGGGWGVAWGLMHRDRFASLALINTGVFRDYRWHRYARIWQTPILGELFMALGNRRGYQLVLGRDNPGLPPAELDRLYDAQASRATQRAILRLYRVTPPNVPLAYRRLLHALDPPTLVLWGTEDAYLPVAQAERQRETFPSATVHRLDGLGHWPFLEDPVRVEEHLLPFLRSVLSAPAAAGGSTG